MLALVGLGVDQLTDDRNAAAPLLSRDIAGDMKQLYLTCHEYCGHNTRGSPHHFPHQAGPVGVDVAELLSKRFLAK